MAGFGATTATRAGCSASWCPVLTTKARAFIKSPSTVVFPLNLSSRITTSGLTTETSSLALKLETTTEELARTIHAHPTLSEIVHEAAEMTLGHSIHI